MYAAVHKVAVPVTRAVWRPEIVGLDNVPATGGVLIASNHLSFIDSVAIPVVVPRKVVFLAKSDYFTGTGLRGRLKRAWFEGIGMLPVDRDDTRAAIESLDVALEVLDRGEAFGIYPEGSRSRDGRLYRGRTGVAHLALTAGVPIVPVAMHGTDQVMPVGASWPRVVKARIRFGTPIQVADRFEGMPLGRARRLLTDEVMDAIAAMSGQERAAEYNDRSVGT